MTEFFFVLFMLCKYFKIKENSLATKVYDKKIDKSKGSARQPEGQSGGVPMDIWTHGRYKTSSKCSNNLDLLQRREVSAHIWVLHSGSITQTFVKWLSLTFRFVISSLKLQEAICQWTAQKKKLKPDDSNNTYHTSRTFSDDNE